MDQTSGKSVWSRDLRQEWHRATMRPWLLAGRRDGTCNIRIAGETCWSEERGTRGCYRLTGVFNLGVVAGGVAGGLAFGRCTRDLLSAATGLRRDGAGFNVTSLDTAYPHFDLLQPFDAFDTLSLSSHTTRNPTAVMSQTHAMSDDQVFLPSMCQPATRPNELVAYRSPRSCAR